MILPSFWWVSAFVFYYHYHHHHHLSICYRPSPQDGAKLLFSLHTIGREEGREHSQLKGGLLGTMASNVH